MAGGLRNLSDETSEFWKSPGITRDEMKRISQTTVYRLPGAGFAEKDGTFVNSARWLQWKGAALPPPAGASSIRRSWRASFLRRANYIRRKAASSPIPILHATWSYNDPLQPIAFRSRAGDQRARRRRCHRSKAEPDLQSRPAASRLRLAARRWFHGLWQLALLRIVDGSRRANAAARYRRSFRSGHLSELGMVVAG